MDDILQVVRRGLVEKLTELDDSDWMTQAASSSLLSLNQMEVFINSQERRWGREATSIQKANSY